MDEEDKKVALLSSSSFFPFSSSNIQYRQDFLAAGLTTKSAFGKTSAESFGFGSTADELKRKRSEESSEYGKCVFYHSNISFHFISQHNIFETYN